MDGNAYMHDPAAYWTLRRLVNKLAKLFALLDVALVCTDDDVRGILTGKKTQFRRAVRNLPEGAELGTLADWNSHKADARMQDADERFLERHVIFRRPVAASEVDGRGIAPSGVFGRRMYPYEPGGRLWVQEVHAVNVPGCQGGTSYRADHLDPRGDGPANPMTWRPAPTMGRSRARIFLDIEAVRVERLCDISIDDVFAEGIRPYDGCKSNQDAESWDPIDYFREQWANGPWKRAPWSQNPFVWVVDFKRSRP